MSCHSILNCRQIPKKNDQQGVIILDLTSQCGPMAFASREGDGAGDKCILNDMLLVDALQRLTEAQRLANIGCWEYNIATGAIWWSPQVYAMFGIIPGDVELTYKAFLDCVHPDDRRAVDEAVRVSLRDRAPYDIVHRIVRPDGHFRFVQELSEIICDDGGQPVQMRGTVQDITDRHEVEESLRKSESRLAGVIGMAAEAIIAVDQDLRIQVFNKSAENIFGYSAGDVIGRPMDILIPERFRNVHKKHVKAFSESDVKSRAMDSREDIVGLRRDGTEFPVEASVSRLEVCDNSVFTVILHDVSEKHAAEAQMRLHAERSRELNAKLALLDRMSSVGMMLASVAHELNQPIAALKLYSGQLLHMAKEWDGAPTGLIDTLGEIDRLTQVSSGVIGRARRNAETPDKPLRQTCVADAVEEVISLLEGRLSSAGVAIEFVPDTDRKSVFVEPFKLELMILNLLRNAIDAFKDNENHNPAERKTIEIRLLQGEADKIVLSISDNGPGASEETVARMFTPFFSTKETGWGFGLPICKQFAYEIGGDLVSKPHIPSGLTFELTLPAADVQ